MLYGMGQLFRGIVRSCLGHTDRGNGSDHCDPMENGEVTAVPPSGSVGEESSGVPSFRRGTVRVSATIRLIAPGVQAEIARNEYARDRLSAMSEDLIQLGKRLHDS